MVKELTAPFPYALIVTLIVIIELATNINGRGTRFAGQTDRVQYFSSSSYSFHLFNTPSNYCVNRQYKTHPPNSDWEDFAPDLSKIYRIIAYKDKKCFSFFHDFNCKGPQLQFVDVQTKDLKLNTVRIDDGSFAERFLNFDIVFRSISACSDSVYNTSHKDFNACGPHSNYSIEIASDKTTEGVMELNETCQNIPELKVVHDHLHEVRKIYVVQEDPFHTNQQDICVETYSSTNCNGQLARFIFPASSFAANKKLCMWETNFGFEGDAIIDTDVKSVRRCPCNKLEDTLSRSTDKSYEISSTSSPNLGPAPSSDQIKGEDMSCSNSFETCMELRSFVYEKQTSADSDLFVFNKSSCGSRPLFQIGKMDKTLLRKAIVNLPKKCKPMAFSWSIAEFPPSYENILEDENYSDYCLSPISNSTFNETLNIISGLSPKSKVNYSNKFKFNMVELIVLIIASVLAVTMLIIVIILGALLWRKKRRIRSIRRGRGNHIPKHRGVATASEGFFHRVNPVEENDYVDDITGLKALCISIQSKGYEIQRESIDIGNIRDSTAQIIGVGEFSIAFKGKLKPEGRTVAVKTMKSGQATARSIKGALRECKVFMDCGKHQRIVEFIGVCTENVRKGEIYTLFEFCDHGTLKSFLVQHRSHFHSLVVDGELRNDIENLSMLAQISIEEGPPVKFNTFQLLKWCLEISEAMEYLALRKIVHVSLSAKNVMLSTNFLSKLSDFHLARIPGESGSNRTNTSKERSIPWRWLAVESLLDEVYSTASDIWAFGIFAWEVFTLGATPYPEHIYGAEFTMCIKHGYRLLKPELATIKSYELMLLCWYDAPEKRPTFSKLRTKLQEMIKL